MDDKNILKIGFIFHDDVWISLPPIKSNFKFQPLDTKLKVALEDDLMAMMFIKLDEFISKNVEESCPIKR